MSSDDPRTLIIGIDGATFDLLRPWVERGELPVLSRFVEEGAHGTLWAWPNTNSAAAWTSMVTGCNGGKHGIFDFGDAPARVGEPWRPVTAATRRVDPFWCLLSDLGQRVGIINVPITYPSDQVNGFMISGMDTPSLHSAGFTCPEALGDDLRGRDYVIDVPNLGELRRRDPRRAAAVLHDMVAKRASTTLHLMRTRSWDTLMSVFVATDRAQHHFWPRAVPKSPTDRDDDAARVLLDLYRQIDAFIGEAMAIAGERATVMVVSDHGFGSRRMGRRALNRLFAELGLLHFNEGGRRWTSSAWANALRLGRRLIPQRLQRPLAMYLPRVRSRMVTESRFANIDWQRTSVFAGTHGSQVYVNLAGRQAGGIVPAEDAEKLLANVREVLLALTDPVSGERVVRSATLRDELYHGPCVDAAPDMMVEWDFATLGDGIRYAAHGHDIVCTADGAGGPGSGWAGEHQPDGIFLVTGPRVRKARLPQVTLYDIAPTVLHLQGTPVPETMDGRVLTEIFEDEDLRDNPVVRSQATHRTTAPDDAPGAGRLSDDEAALIEERLRGLGYIE